MNLKHFTDNEVEIARLSNVTFTAVQELTGRTALDKNRYDGVQCELRQINLNDQATSHQFALRAHIRDGGREGAVRPVLAIIFYDTCVGGKVCSDLGYRDTVIIDTQEGLDNLAAVVSERITKWIAGVVWHNTTTKEERVAATGIL